MKNAAAEPGAERIPWTPRCVTVGEWRITALTDGFLRLDGGSMWGVVPKAMWQELTPPADDNTIQLALRPFLCERGDVKLVIEGGIGERWDAKWREIYGIQQPTTLAQALAGCGVAPEDVTHVFASHCHFDHIGALVVERDGRLAPLFPNARHFAPRIEIEVAKSPDHLRRASYRPEDVTPLADAGLLEPFDADGPLAIGPAAGGARVHEAAGHSDGVSILTLNEDGPGDTAIFWADVVPTGHHIQPPYIMAFDLDQPRSFASRSRWLARAAEGGWLGLFYHDLDHPFGRVTRNGKRYGLAPEPGETRAHPQEAR